MCPAEARPLSGAGAADVAIAIPNGPNLRGLEFGMQWVASQVGANAAGLVTSASAAAQTF